LESSRSDIDLAPVCPRLKSVTAIETTGADFMPNCLRQISLRPLLLTGVALGLFATGCGSEEPLPSPASDQYKEAKRRGDEARAKEYGRKSVYDKKATLTPPAPKVRR
jgi:hypothetical protein